jgi:hypothetical protein
MKKSKEFENFDLAVRRVLSVPHGEIKAKLDAEKKAKAAKKRNALLPRSPALPAPRFRKASPAPCR